jgi:O-antigen ligase
MESMELSYLNRTMPRIDRKLFLLVLVFTLGATFALWEFPVYSVALMVSILLAALVYKVPELGIAVLVNGLYLVGFFWRGVQIPYLITPLAVALSCVGLAHYALNHGIRWRFGILPALVVAIGLMLFLGISYSPLPSEGLIRAGKYLSMNLFIFFAVMLFVDDLERLESLIKMIALTGMVAALVSIVYIAFTGAGDIARFALPAQNPIWFARGMGMSLFATLFLVERTKRKTERSVYLCFMPILLFLLYTAGSRGPLVALLITLFFYYFVLQEKRYGLFKKVLSVILIFGFLGLSVAIAPQRIWNRMFNLVSGFDITTFLRIRSFETAKSLFLENPLKGVGTGGFGYFNVSGYPHNIFLEFASELGIIGLSAFLVFVIYAAYLGIKLVRSKSSSIGERKLGKTYLALFVFSLVNSQFSGAAWSNYELWFSVAGIWVLYASRRGALPK